MIVFAVLSMGNGLVKKITKLDNLHIHFSLLCISQYYKSLLFYLRLLVTTNRRMASLNTDVISIQQELGTKVHIGKVTSGGLYKKLTCPTG